MLRSKRVLWKSRQLLSRVAGLVYPILCLGCEQRLYEADSRSLPLCPACLRKLPRAEEQAVAERLSRLQTTQLPIGRAFALWTFDEGGTIQRVQHVLKYGNRPALGVALGQQLGQALRSAWPSTTYDAVVPVPLGRVRMLERGYNQSERLAAGVAEALALPLLRGKALARVRNTRSQTSLSREERTQNVDGAFASSKHVIPTESHLLLIDDVLTTGATLSAAAGELRGAGARVDVAVLAIAAS